jgi:MOSC domain-containing protein YiiM
MKTDVKLISVNVGLPRVVVNNGEPVSTGIFKEPVAGRVMLRTLNLEGDRQADLSVHGGPSKAVYVYPSEHYDYWKDELPEMKLPWGMFGENFTTAGLFESELNIGDRFQVGSAIVMVTEPRMPCYKLGINVDIKHLHLHARQPDARYYLGALLIRIPRDCSFHNL